MLTDMGSHFTMYLGADGWDKSSILFSTADENAVQHLVQRNGQAFQPHAQEDGETTLCRAP